MSHAFGKSCFARLAMLLPLAVAGCQTPHVVSPEDGKRCEARGYVFGTDAYMDCAAKLKAEPESAAAIPTATPAAASPGRQVCDASQPTQTPTTRYVLRGEVVYDQKTDLTWKRCSVGQDWVENSGCVGVPVLLTWDQALAGPKTGWRLPTQDELLTLASPTCKFPSVNEEAFPNMDPETLWYWSSTPNGESAVWGVNFREGRSSSADNTLASGAIRLVHSGR
jgi:hypothetical protein